MRTITETSAITARVVVNFGSHLLLDDMAGNLLQGVTQGRRLRPVCGDYVRWTTAGDGSAVVTEVLPRRNELVRHDLRNSQRVLAANLDYMLIVVAAKPEPDLAMVDRYLAGAEVLGIRPVLVFNKADLLSAGDSKSRQLQFMDLTSLDYPLLWVSTKTGLGMDGITALLANGTGIVVGQSGVGKSSLVDYLLPDQALRIQAISSASGAGQHTTTATHLYSLPDSSGSIIDSPGVRDFRLWPMPPQELARGFREIREAANACRFQDCRHLHEPQCEVKRRVTEGAISARRYASYVQLVEWSAAN